MEEIRMPSDNTTGDQRLESLLQAYRAACEPGEVSVNFMPELWKKIDSVQNATFSFRRIAKSFVTVAAVLSVVLAVIGFVPLRNAAPVYSSTYVEELAANNDTLSSHGPESVQYALELMHPDLVDDGAGEI